MGSRSFLLWLKLMTYQQCSKGSVYYGLNDRFVRVSLCSYFQEALCLILYCWYYFTSIQILYHIICFYGCSIKMYGQHHFTWIVDLACLQPYVEKWNSVQVQGNIHRSLINFVLSRQKDLFPLSLFLVLWSLSVPHCYFKKIFESSFP